MKFLVQFVAYAVFAAFVGLLSIWPSYQLLAPDQAIVSLAISHAGQRLGECRRLTQEELNELPPNMRKPSDCPRERHPIRVELRADGVVLYQETSPPSGLWSDGKATVYQRLQMQAGRHELFIGMNDSGGDSGFDFELKSTLVLSPGQNLVIDFDELLQAFVFR
jgi:hypothetical protein